MVRNYLEISFSRVILTFQNLIFQQNLHKLRRFSSNGKLNENKENRFSVAKNYYIFYSNNKLENAQYRFKSQNNLKKKKQSVEFIF